MQYHAVIYSMKSYTVFIIISKIFFANTIWIVEYCLKT